MSFSSRRLLTKIYDLNLELEGEFEMENNLFFNLYYSK